ncbi:ATP-binding protein [Vitiosangium sp. GDMCC 1.1324]|uniref:sensor histidine kinase n=1 Tax=Vitiosangium sp. (strain GDMCC 1.1324) TaxID=2138576 RepID=UPI000D3D4F79|nr:ATP-binding protein [Vitiosangium sp. GDMCC 1.1324]PTL77738.1 sensor histidine kinase [Vitiosangium sp. GDMCC 1.1324]
MRIATKLWLGLTLTTALILGSYGYRQMRQEQADLRHSVDQEFKLLGTAIQVAVENALRDGQTADIREILDSLEFKDPATDVFVFDAQARLSASSWSSSLSLPALSGAVAEVLASREPVVRFEGPAGLSHLVAVLPLRDDNNALVGALALVRPLDDVRRDLTTTALAIFLSILTLVAGIAAVGWLLFHLYVRQPLASLVTAMRSVRGGDLQASVSVNRRDEVGEVAVEFNEMLSELAEVRRRLAQEEDSRRALNAELQRVDKLITIGQLAAGVAHEIGSPLQVLNGRARALAGRPDITPEVRRNADILVEQSDRIARIIQQLLNLARRKPPRFEEIDVRTAGRAIFELLELDARRRGVRLEFEAPEVLPRVPADGDQIQQVILNLLGNALRATPRGGRVKLSLAPSSFQAPGSSAERASVSLVVEDTGTGMTEEVLARMFEPFFTAWGDAGGTGLGLAVVKSIIAEHGGILTVDSRKDEGTRFTVHLPVRNNETKELTV